jgi:hypothetical protein
MSGGSRVPSRAIVARDQAATAEAGSPTSVHTVETETGAKYGNYRLLNDLQAANLQIIKVT